MSCPTEKRILSLDEHQTILRMLKQGTRLREPLRTLYMNTMDEKLVESKQIAEVLRSLCNSSKTGRLAEFALRQWINRDGVKIHPIEYPGLPRFGDVKPLKGKKFQKSLNLFKCLLQTQMYAKIEANPGAIQRERKNEEFLRVVRREQEKGFDILCQLGLPSFDNPILLSSEKQDLKRKCTEIVCQVDIKHCLI